MKTLKQNKQKTIFNLDLISLDNTNIPADRIIILVSSVCIGSKFIYIISLAILTPKLIKNKLSPTVVDFFDSCRKN